MAARSVSTVTGTFSSRDQAERAVETLRREGFRDNEISIVGRREEGGAQRRGNEGAGMNNVSDGTAWGAGIGAGAGLLASAGALAIPGIGPLVAMGPLAATLGGAATGGLAGGLADMGIDMQEGRALENEVRQGRYVALIQTAENASKAQEVLERAGAQNVKVHEGR